MSCHNNLPEPTGAESGNTGLPASQDSARELTQISDAEFAVITNAAIDWQFLTAKGGGMARKSELDAWLMQRFCLTMGAAHEVSNFIESRRAFSADRDRLYWHTDETGRPEPQFEDYPDLAARFHISP